MKLLHKDLGTLVEITHTPDGKLDTSHRYYRSYNCFQMTGEEFDSLKNQISKISNTPVASKDIVYFSKYCSMPKLLINKLDIGITRTIKKDKSNKIVIDRAQLNKLGTIEYSKSGYVIYFDRDVPNHFISDKTIEELRDVYGYSLEKVQSAVKGTWVKIVWIDKSIKLDTLDLVLQYPDKIISTTRLAKYMNSKLPTLDEESTASLIGLFKGDQEARRLALNMIVGINMSAMLYDICIALNESRTEFSANLRNTINYKYLQCLIGTSIKSFTGRWTSGNWYQAQIGNILYRKGCLDDAQKEKAWKKWFEYNFDSTDYDGNINVKRITTCNSCKMPYHYDPNRAAEIRNRAMEEGWL